MKTAVDRDERTLAVENASFRVAYQIMSFGLLVLVAYRSLRFHEAAWDLMALVLVGGVVASAYQGRRDVLTKRWLVNGLASLIAAAVVAAVLVWLGR
jgi:hypothetical protein